MILPTDGIRHWSPEAPAGALRAVYGRVRVSQSLQGVYVRLFRMFLFLSLASLAFLSPQLLVPGSHVEAQQASDMPPPPHAKQIHLKHVLVVGQTKGFEHDSVSAAMAAVYNMGKESGLWGTVMRTYTDLQTKKNIGRNAKNLNYFDLIVFASTTGELDMDQSQKDDMMSFIKD